MTVYVDSLRKYGSKLWAHMLADTTEELHAMASTIGLRREWYQGDHYDVQARKHAAAIRAGAVLVTTRDLVNIRKALTKG